MLRKDAAISWTEECQKAFDKIKEYLSKPPVLVPPKPRTPLLLYLSMLDGAFGCILGHHHETGRKEQAIYYLSKNFMPYEARYYLLECTCCALTWIAQKFRHYFCAYTTYLISRMDPLKCIFQKPMPTSKLAKWQILLSEFDIIYITQKAVKGQALVDHLTENPEDGEYEPLEMYFPDENETFVGEDITEAYDDSDLLVHQVLGEWATKNTKILPYLHYVQELIKRFIKIEFKHVLMIHNEFADALDTLSSMIQHPDKNFIDLIPFISIQLIVLMLKKRLTEITWFHDIKEYFAKGEYPEQAAHTQKCTLQILANHFFQNEVNAKEAS
ncbi:uncharacterized protein [Nicotiana tomentosiformis]|uniref:uncharacterized protein n=1 Tax=Nicotiana tomentosiformis TaxID=4098 RepID=UPI00388CC3A8